MVNKKNQSPLFRLAHISDLHFAKLSYSPLQFFSKRWLGNFNLLLSRNKIFEHSHLFSLPALFKQLKVTHVIVTGDITTTSRKREFLEAVKLIKQIQEAGITTFIIPGNHDHYTKKAYKKRLFYRFFKEHYSYPGPIGQYNLKDHGVAASYLGTRWWLVGMDTTLATSWFSSQGLFSFQIERHLYELLSHIPKDDMIVLINHFPFFHNDNPKKSLMRAEALKEMLFQHPNIRLYLHGHTHRQCLADLRVSNLPILLDSGSTAHKKGASLNLIDITKEGSEIHLYEYHSAQWMPVQQTSFLWNTDD